MSPTTLVITSEQRVVGSADTGWYCEGTGGAGYEYWKRYNSVFANVIILCRARAEALAVSGVRVDGDGVQIAPIPYYLGALAAALRFSEVRAAIQTVVDTEKTRAVYLLRAPGTLAAILGRILLKEKVPYGVEVLGDPAEVLNSTSGVKIAFRSMLRPLAVISMKRTCEAAAVVSYVTTNALQSRYPAKFEDRMFSCSDAWLAPNAFSLSPRRFIAPLMSPKLISVGTMEQLYKGFDILIAAASELRRRGIAATLTFAGDGKHRLELERLARKSVGKNVIFLGNVRNRSELLGYLDGSDLFVMPSRTEGLPKALVEAMARGLPAVGSTVGGIPELVPHDCTAIPGDAASLCNAIERLCRDVARLNQCAEVNWIKAQSFRTEEGQMRLGRFLAALRSSR